MSDLQAFCAVMAVLLWAHGYTKGRAVRGYDSGFPWFYRGYTKGRQDERSETERLG